MQTTMSEERWFGHGDVRLRGVAAWRADRVPAPAVIIIPDVHGVSDLYERIGERFAAAGFVAFVLDIYSREGAPRLADLPAVFAWIAELDDRRVLGDVAAAAAYVRSLPEVNGNVGVIGFCLGGQYALLAACSGVPVAAAVSFYGMLRYSEHNEHKPAGPLDVAAGLGCPYLGLFGAEDGLIPLADVDELEATLRRHDKRFAVKVYPGAGHAFCNDTRADAYRPEAAADALARAEAFLREHLSAA
jgi:carboxymethylenebutenolidase